MHGWKNIEAKSLHLRFKRDSGEKETFWPLFGPSALRSLSPPLSGATPPLYVGLLLSIASPPHERDSCSQESSVRSQPPPLRSPGEGKRERET